jgi:hypothetical protein
MQRNKEFGLPNKSVFKTDYLAQSRRDRREKNLSASAPLRDKNIINSVYLLIHTAARAPA